MSDLYNSFDQNAGMFHFVLTHDEKLTEIATAARNLCTLIENVQSEYSRLDGLPGADAYDVAAIAKYAGRAHSTVWTAIQTGKLKGVRLGGRWWVNRCDAERYISSCHMEDEAKKMRLGADVTNK